jgi:RNA polymerase sigma-70 factor, ECF subfamily
MDEQQLIRLAQEGDTAAFEELVGRYERRVLSLIRTFIRDRNDAMDVFQEVFMRVWMGIKRFRLEASFYTWVYRITVNRCLTWHDQRGRRERLHLEPWEDNEEGEDWLARMASQQGIDSGLSEDGSARRRLLGKIWQAAETLKPKQRLIFFLRYQHGLQVKEIAEIFDMPEGTVKILAFRAIRQLREQLKDELA